MKQLVPPVFSMSTSQDSRCWWCLGSEEYRHYHDTEWGFPVADDRRLFEKICLEGFQSGLSWLTILRKRENFRAAFSAFDFHAVARFGEKEVARLMADAGIVRHRGKILAAIQNATRAIELTAEAGSLAAFFWAFEPPATERPTSMTRETLITLGKTPSSVALSKALRKRGWRYVGPTTCYAFMQAMGLVNDHVEGCPTRAKVTRARLTFCKKFPVSRGR